jgi:hypothetical protein
MKSFNHKNKLSEPLIKQISMIGMSIYSGLFQNQLNHLIKKIKGSDNHSQKLKRNCI